MAEKKQLAVSFPEPMLEQLNATVEASGSAGPLDMAEIIAEVKAEKARRKA